MVKRTTLRRLVPLLAAATLAAVPAAAAASTPAAAHRSVTEASPSRARPPVVAGSDYLALGDSVPFGYRESTSTPPPDYHDPASLVGYPEVMARALHLSATNLACPGETTASFINPAAQSNRCENSIVAGKSVPVGYRTLYPLHAKYPGSQLAAAVAYLKAHHHTRLVSLMIGANDGFVCEDLTADHCTSTAEIDAYLSRAEADVTHILRAVRKVYAGQLVVVDYYSLDYTSALDNEEVSAINTAVGVAAAPFGVEVANGYKAFYVASASSGHRPCSAGLLTKLTTGGCGIHPSASGQALLARTVEAAVTR